MAPALAGIRVELDAPEPITGEWNCDAVASAVCYLAELALKYSDRTSPVKVRLAEVNGWAQIRVNLRANPLSSEELATWVTRCRSEAASDPKAPPASAEAARIEARLAFAREIAEATGGRLSAESSQADGTTFALTLGSGSASWRGRSAPPPGCVP